MFLTRLGFDSKAVITGDTTQVDLPPEKVSGLIEAAQVLKDVEGIGFMRFTDADVVRHPLVQSIIRAYEGAAQRAADERSASNPQTSEAHQARGRAGIDSDGT